MLTEPVNAPDAPQPSGGYAQAVRLSDFDQLVFVSGQIPVDVDGVVPDAFADQCRLVWRNVEAQLRAAGLGLADRQGNDLPCRPRSCAGE